MLHFGQKAHNQIEIPPPADTEPSAPGAYFGNAAARLMEHELDGTTGWRPNDLLIWGPRVAADNNANRQLGVLQALRETLRIFKDELTKVSSDTYDRNLVEADNLLRNDPHKWAFPSAESRYRDAVARLDAYVVGLRGANPASRPIITRNTELIPLLEAWNTLLGAAHADLYRTDTDWLQVDDDFYRVTGYCQVIANMAPAVEHEYAQRAREPPRPACAVSRDPRAARALRRDQADLRLQRPRQRHARQPAPQPRLVRQRGAAEDLLDPRRAREVGAGGPPDGAQRIAKANRPRIAIAKYVATVAAPA